MIGAFGAPTTAAAAGLIYLAGALILVGFSGPTAHESISRGRLVETVRGGLRLVRLNQTVRFLIIVAFVAELLAFSAIALDPVFAVGVFKSGSRGLGEIVDARGIGRIGGAILLVLVHPRNVTTRWLAASMLVFGVGLVGYGTFPLLVALIFMALAGAGALMVDSLEQAGLQSSVDGSARGRVAGLWVVILGLGPVGVAEVGCLAATFGAPAALLINGATVIAFGLFLLVRVQRRRFPARVSRPTASRGP